MANPNAKVLGVKAAVAELLEQEAVLQKALRTGNLSDETYLYLEEKQVELKSAILDLLEDKPLDTDEKGFIILQQHFCSRGLTQQE